jgi:hypothetical protein
MSLFWSQWTEGSTFYNKDTVQALKCSWNANVVRAAMGVEEGGYLTNAALEQGKAETIIQAAIDLGIYVIVDWHDHNAQVRSLICFILLFSSLEPSGSGCPVLLGHLQEIRIEPAHHLRSLQ